MDPETTEETRTDYVIEYQETTTAGLVWTPVMIISPELSDEGETPEQAGRWWLAHHREKFPKYTYRLALVTTTVTTTKTTVA